MYCRDVKLQARQWCGCGKKKYAYETTYYGYRAKLKTAHTMGFEGKGGY